ncbi:hypothetical protein NXS19_007915 [Fusarium pseudograminearum]|nr:hypothetical protein NXS19_007915 [Fusarium pseudograminearum]
MASNLYTQLIEYDRLPFPLLESLLSFECYSSQQVCGNADYTPFYTNSDFDTQSCYDDVDGNSNREQTTLEHHWIQKVRQPLNALLRERFQLFINTVQWTSSVNAPHELVW